jgi:hypothetical protein
MLQSLVKGNNWPAMYVGPQWRWKTQMMHTRTCAGHKGDPPAHDSYVRIEFGVCLLLSILKASEASPTSYPDGSSGMLPLFQAAE